MTLATLEHGAGLYLHVPFCNRICPYCDYAALIAGEQRRQSFLSAVRAEIELYHDLPLVFDTVYLGGGTPSLLQPLQLEELLRACIGQLRVDANAEVFVEANPEDVNDDLVAALHGLGVTSLSLGVQSFDPDALNLLGRSHTPALARRALERALTAGFTTVSCDLIYGYPGHTPEDWRRQLEEVVELRPHHLSCYQLTVHTGTVFGKHRDRGELRELGDDRQADLLLLTHELLTDLGYLGYEVSNFALAAEHRSAHNRKYWEHVPYLGLGPSAHSFWQRRRWWNQPKLRLWQAALARGELPLLGEETLSVGELAFEAVMLGLRTAAGVDLGRISSEYGIDLVPANAALIDQLQEQRLVNLRGGRLVPSLRGMALADSLACMVSIPEP